MNVSYEPVWRSRASDWPYQYTFDRVDYYGNGRVGIAVFGNNATDWTFIQDLRRDWDRAPQSARDHLTALDALHR